MSPDFDRALVRKGLLDINPLVLLWQGRERQCLSLEIYHCHHFLAASGNFNHGQFKIVLKRPGYKKHNTCGRH